LGRVGQVRVVSHGDMTVSECRVGTQCEATEKLSTKVLIWFCGFDSNYLELVFIEVECGGGGTKSWRSTAGLTNISPLDNLECRSSTLVYFGSERQT